MKMIGIWGSAVAITLFAMAQESPRVSIQDVSSDAVAVIISGGPGVHSLRKKEDIAAPDTTEEEPLTTKTNIAAQKKGPKGFFLARTAPTNDVHIFTNTLGMLDEGRNIFRYDTFGDEAFLGRGVEVASGDCRHEQRRSGRWSFAQNGACCWAQSGCGCVARIPEAVAGAG